MPFFLEAAILSRILSPVTSRSELSEREQHVQSEAAHRGGGVELLRDRHERNSLSVEELDHLGEIRQ